MATSLVTQHTLATKKLVHYVISEDLDGDTYDDVLSGDILLPANSLVTLIDTDDVKTTKLVSGSVEVEWDSAEAITLTTASVSSALADKTEIAALTGSSTAADIVSALQA